MIPVAISLILIGGLFIFLMGRSYLRAKEMREWPTVPCVILSSSIEERQHDPYSPVEYSHQIIFGYEWQDQAHTSDLVSLRGSKWSSKPQPIEQSLTRYPAGSQQLCHVNPQDPQLAVLELDSLAPLYSIWFPALFAVGGVVMLWSCLKPASGRRAS